ncbi:hypothetical protein ACWELO_14065 [Streptomyces sp. NPDC004596]
MLVCVISARVGATLRTEPAGAGVPQALAGKPAGAEDAVATGVAPVPGGMPETLRAAVVTGSERAFMDGLHTSAAVTGVLCLPGALLAAAGTCPSRAAGRTPAGD